MPAWVRSRSALSVIMQCVSITALASVLWLVLGYTLSFGDSQGGIIGGLGKVFFAGVQGTQSGTIPEIVFAIFQMTFAIITPALIVGAYVERIKFSSVLVFSGAWLLFVYSPICHWVWGGGWLGGTRHYGLRRRFGGPCQRGIGCPGGRRSTGITAGLPRQNQASAQSWHDRGGCGNALGRLVRFQRRQSARR